MSLPGSLEPVHPVVSIDDGTAASTRAVVDTISGLLADALEWSHDEGGVFGQMSTSTPTATVDVRFLGDDACGTVRIVAGSCGERPIGGHWTRTLDVTGMSAAIASLPRIERTHALVRFVRRLVDAAASDDAIRVEAVGCDPRWEAARRHARCLAAELGSASGEEGCPPLTEIMVRHPYGGAPGIVTVNGAGSHPRTARPCGIDLPSLASMAFVGTEQEGTVYVSGCMRTASVSAAMVDPVTTLRLLKELSDSREGRPR